MTIERWLDDSANPNNSHWGVVSSDTIGGPFEIKFEAQDPRAVVIAQRSGQTVPLGSYRVTLTDGAILCDGFEGPLWPDAPAPQPVIGGRFAFNLTATTGCGDPDLPSADLNGDGGLTSDDFLGFLNVFFGSTPGPGGFSQRCLVPLVNGSEGFQADYNGDCGLTSDDFLQILTGFFAGC